MDFKKEAYLYQLFHYTGKKRFSREHTKNLNANDRARQADVKFWAVGYPPPHQSHILCKIWELTYMQKD